MAPPQVTISTSFAGASPEDLYRQVTQPIEEELNGTPGLLYFESTSDATGSVSITVTFGPGTQMSQAVVDTQNRLRRVESSLPEQVRQQGVLVEEAGTSFLMMIALTVFGLANDVFFTVGLITIIGLSAKNAILIVEVAKDMIAEGHELFEATVVACRLRFRPILMTSLAFTMGVVPMAIATGPSAASQNAIGINVVGGMLAATILGTVFAPVFFVWVMKLFGTHKRLGKGGSAGSQDGSAVPAE